LISKEREPLKRVGQNSGMALIGYARVSTDEQNLALQHDALTAGCKIVYEDGKWAVIERSGLDRGYGGRRCRRRAGRLEAGPPRPVARIYDRPDRPLGKNGAGFMSLSDGIDTTTASGKLVSHIMGALVEFERSLISERAKAGMKRQSAGAVLSAGRRN
jgi:hypothetical protein